MNLIKIKNLNFSYYDNLILKNIFLEAFENEKILLIGPNGAGKSTLIRILSGVETVMNLTLWVQVLPWINLKVSLI